ncbi:hypothetical protein CG716_22470 [Mycolicibacterium sphagni]|uniref:Uncharacterized protein n=1 Tax=Mycolicibacterium sphagni TaxID=1786 RepID=A0A255DGS2_9MYCO|nr:hypothetical protein [Mycolicibacterium sphagni]OYN76415.1 hypothetical protein CG716_22470 [Mycolicibacterium sphagni]
MSKRAAGLFASVAAAGALTLGLSFAPTASAADGCGIGYHLEGPTCVLNVPGPDAHFISPNCWININGDERCYVP